MTARSRPLVYSRDRAKRLRVVLWLTLALGVFVGVLELGALASPDADHQLAGIALAIYAVVALLAAGTLVVLDRRDAATRLSATGTATILAMVGVLTVETVFGLLSLLLGLGLLALSVLPDQPEAYR